MIKITAAATVATLTLSLTTVTFRYLEVITPLSDCLFQAGYCEDYAKTRLPEGNLPGASTNVSSLTSTGPQIIASSR